jgi:phage terminase large subunit-like protein
MTMPTPPMDSCPKTVADLEGLLGGPLPTTFEEAQQAFEHLRIERERRAGYKMRAYFPDTGPYRRELYPKHIAFLNAGAIHRERLFLAGNRVGKSDVGSYEVACHLTGLYPHWWKGRRFDRPIKAWAAGDTSKTVRDIIQPKLVGEQGQYGTGMIPAHTMHHVSHKSGAPGAVDTVWVKHVSGGLSTLGLKSYEQRREAFQGTSIEVIWLDEEPDQDIVTECLLRTMDTPTMPGGGLLMLTFTPLKGMTPLILSFLQDSTGGSAPAQERPKASSESDERG